MLANGVTAATLGAARFARSASTVGMTCQRPNTADDQATAAGAGPLSGAETEDGPIGKDERYRATEAG